MLLVVGDVAGGGVIVAGVVGAAEGDAHVGVVAGGGVIVAGVVGAAEGDAHVAAIVASATATYKVPDVLHTSSALTPSACCSLWATFGRRGLGCRRRRVALLVRVETARVLLVVGDVAGGGVIVAGLVGAAEGDAHVAAVVASAAATYKIHDVLHTSAA